jgi:cardiolipin synthase
VIRDGPFAANLRARLLAAMQEGSQPIAVDEHRRRGWWQRAWGWIAYGLLRLGVLVSGERQRY